MPIELTPNNRGFIVGKFRDRYAAECSIQKSSLATENCIWLGCDELGIEPVSGQPFAKRMHLTQEMARDLVPLLTRFAETGDLL